VLVGWDILKKGLDGLKQKPALGRPAELTERQKQQLEKILLKGPLKVGYSTDLWTLKRIAEIIEKRFRKWKRYKWSRIKKAQQLNAHPVFLYESGFLLIPNLIKT
jgi:hypothetical protein